MIYLDNNATTPVSDEANESMRAILSGDFGNPSSAHSAGRSARKVIENARAEIAGFLGAADPSEIAFTSGGTESDNWAILGSLETGQTAGKRHLITTSVEHEAVRKAFDLAETRGFRVTRLGVDRDGNLDLDQLRGSLSAETALVSVMMANNETGVIFPIEEITEIVKGSSDAVIHVDAVNAAGKIPINAAAGNVDLLSISAHKFYGPKGIGALYIRSGVELQPLFAGGSQESGRRPGTEPVHQIAGMAAAARAAADLGRLKVIELLRDRLESGLLGAIPQTRVNGSTAKNARLPNTSNISFSNTNGEMILAMLDELGIYVSTGSACNSGNVRSPVLAAMEVPYIDAMGSIRFSLGRGNNEAEIDEVLSVLPPIIERLRSMGGTAAEAGSA